jgi:hypothetical protein
MDKTDHLMVEKNENNKDSQDSQKWQVTPKKCKKTLKDGNMERQFIWK